jgi:Zn-dependent peptidase ImmA (M78 family)
MKQPKIAKSIQKLITQTHNSFTYNCLCEDTKYDSRHYMNIFAIELISACCDMMAELEQTHSTEDTIEEIKKHFGVETDLCV